MANGDKKPLVQEKKRARNIGLKNKRLLMHNEDAMELKVTWEEAHELLRPPPTCKPTISMIEDCEFEEYDVSLMSPFKILALFVSFISFLFVFFN